jgi:hypothetical protein
MPSHLPSFATVFFIMAQIGVNDAAASPDLFGFEIRSLLDAGACDAIWIEPAAPSTAV